MTGAVSGAVVEGAASALRAVRARFAIPQTTSIKQVGPFFYQLLEDGKPTYLYDGEAALEGPHGHLPTVPNPFTARPAVPATSAYSTPFRCTVWRGPVRAPMVHQRRCTAAPGALRWLTYTHMAQSIEDNKKSTAKDAQEPPSPKISTSETPMVPAKMSDKDYHLLADEFLDRLMAHLEDLQDKRTDVEVDFADGVISVAIADVGTYVINKQPHNKQIWLSSPVSGPKRYDYMVIGDGMQDKAGTAYSEWIYERDGTTITELFKKELRMDLMMETGTYR